MKPPDPFATGGRNWMVRTARHPQQKANQCTVGPTCPPLNCRSCLKIGYPKIHIIYIYYYIYIIKYVLQIITNNHNLSSITIFHVGMSQLPRTQRSSKSTRDRTSHRYWNAGDLGSTTTAELQQPKFHERWVPQPWPIPLGCTYPGIPNKFRPEMVVTSCWGVVSTSPTLHSS